MKALLRKIRQILRDRKTRRIFTRLVSTVAAIVVFVTTYALVLPAITMESEAACGIEAHQHDQSCYTDVLVCELPESPGHVHDESCYSKKQKMVCQQDEHTHDSDCYDENGELICEKTEHQHGEDCFGEVRELVCEIPESPGHQHDDSCYQKVLTCGKEVHTHSTACYRADTASQAATEAIAVASTESAAAAATGNGLVDNLNAPAEYSESETSLDSSIENNVIEGNLDDSSNYSEPGSDSTSLTNEGDKDEPGVWTSTEATADATAATAASTGASAGAAGSTGSTTGGTAATAAPAGATDTMSTAAGYVPVLDELNFDTLLNKHTGIYYSRLAGTDSAVDNEIDGTDATADTGGTQEEAAAANTGETQAKESDLGTNSGEKKEEAVAENTGELQEVATWNRIDKHTELKESDNLRLYLAYTIPAGSLNETNQTARYSLSKNIHLTDEQVDEINATVNGIAGQYVSYDTLEILDQEMYGKYLGIEAVEGTRTPADDLEEYLANNEGQEFISATVKVENVFDENTGLLKAQDLVFTFAPYTIQKNQHQYDSEGQPIKAGEEVNGWLAIDISTEQIDWEKADDETKTADIIFVEKDKKSDLKEIRTELRLVGAEVDSDTDTNVGNAANGVSSDVAATDNKQDGTKDSETAAGESDKAEKEPVSYPSVSFDDSITVAGGSLSTDTDEAPGDAGMAAETEITVHVEADKDTFPEGTTMVLSAVSDEQMTTVAEAVEGAVDAPKTMGFHAVDISFRDVKGNEIEPLKPIRVSMTSDAIRRAVQDESTAPVVVHVSDPSSDQNAADENTDDGGSTDTTDADEAEAEDVDSQHILDSSESTEEQVPGSNLETTPSVNIIETDTGTKENNGDTLIFEAEAFSVYAIVYTVDFHWEVDGKEYEFSIPGGGFVSFFDLVKVLGIVVNDLDTEKDEIRELVDSVDSIVFSNPDLISISKVNEDTTVGAIKDGLGLECEYSSELTEEQIAEINAREVNAGDWAIIALKPFRTEETLTVTMKNGEAWTVKVTDQLVDPDDFTSNNSYVTYIYTKAGNTYYALKEDGTTAEIQGGLEAIELLGNEYKWTVTVGYRESNGYQFDFRYRYYVIRPYNDDGKSLKLTASSPDQLSVSDGTFYTFIIDHENGATGSVSGAHAIGGKYNSNDEWFFINRPCEVRVKSDGTLYTLRRDYYSASQTRFAPIWFYSPSNTAYEFNVMTNNYEMGYVEGWGKPQDAAQTEAQYYSEVSQFTTRTVYNALAKKKNAFEIKAIPRGTTNPSNPKYVFDYWTLNGTQLDKRTYGATIAEETLEISGDNDNLVAHFSPNLDYQPTAEELLGRTPTTREAFEEWMREVKNSQDALVDSSCDKTAEVYDYENRIYQIDLTASSNLSTFDGTVDMAYILDVSASMKFPSKLMGAKVVYGLKSNGEYYTANECATKNLNNIESEWESWGLKKKENNKTKYYYVIADAGYTATVCMLWHDGSHWMMVDASKGINSTDKFRADDYHQTYWAEYSQRIVPILESVDNITGNESGTMGEVLTSLRTRNLGISLNVGDPIPRLAYLESSVRDSIKEMYTIKNDLSLASDPTKDYWPKIAYNLFCGWMMNPKSSHNFVPAPEDGNLGITYQYAGSTSTDLALLDAAGVTRSDMGGQEYNPDNTDKTKSPSTFGNWKKDESTTTGYTYDEHEDERDEYGFQWDPDSTARYAILITDGAPQRQGKNIGKHFLTDAKEYFQKYSEDSEGNPATLVSVGLSLDNVLYGQNLLYNISDRDSLGTPYYYRAGSGDDLIRVIYEALQKTVSNTIVTGEITDTIGQSFYPVDKNTGNALKNGDWIKLNGEKITNAEKSDYEGKEYLYGVVKVTREVKNGKTENVYTIEWSNQNIKKQSGDKKGWHGTVYVKAKEDYLGGNFVDTNDGNTVIQAEGFRNREDAPIITLNSDYKEQKTLSTPRVNVNDLNITFNDTEWTVYLGEEVDPKAELEALYDRVLIEQVITNGTDTNNDSFHVADHVADDSLRYPLKASDSDGRDNEALENRKTFRLRDLIEELTGSGNLNWEKLLEDSEKTGTEMDPKEEQNIGMEIPYQVYGNHDSSVIRISLEKVVVEGEEDDLNESPHATTVAGRAVEKYTLSVKFLPDIAVLPDGTAGNTIADYHLGRFGSKKEGIATGNEYSENVHTINVYAKPLDILKVDEENEPIIKPATFELLRAWNADTDSEEDDADKMIVFGTTPGYAGYKKNGTNLTGTYYLVESQTTGADGIAHFGAGTDPDKLLSAASDTYILIEKTQPAGYSKDVNVKTIKIVNNGTGMNLYSDLAKVALPAAAYPNAAYPYNWNQAVRFEIAEYDEAVQTDRTSVINYVNKSSGNTVILKKPVSTQNRPWSIPANGQNRDPFYVFSNIENTKEMIRDDVDGTGVFRIRFINGPGCADITFFKTGGDGSTGLAGAVFQLQVDKSGNGNYVKVTSDDEFKDIGGISASLEVMINNKLETFESAFLTGGSIQTLTQLPEGTYKLVELHTPDGYVSTLGDIVFKIEDGKMTMITEVNDGDKIRFVPGSDGDEPTPALLTVINEPGAALPSTGGSGTNLIYLLGLMLTGLAGAGLSMKRRRNAA